MTPAAPVQRKPVALLLGIEAVLAMTLGRARLRRRGSATAGDEGRQPLDIAVLLATALGLLALWALKALENRLRLEHRARLMLEFDTAALSEEEIRERLTGQGFTVSVVRTRLCRDVGLRRLTLDVCYFRRAMPTQTPNVINELAATRGVSDLDWRVVS